MHAHMRAFTTFNIKLYPIQHAEGPMKRLKDVHDISKKNMKLRTLRGKGWMARRTDMHTKNLQTRISASMFAHMGGVNAHTPM
jgi:hypothetical protein